MTKSQLKHLDAIQKLFGHRSTCDFCEDDNCIIMRIIVHPTFDMEGEEMVINGAIMAKKCVACCKGASE